MHHAASRETTAQKTKANSLPSPKHIQLCKCTAYLNVEVPHKQAQAQRDAKPVYEQSLWFTSSGHDYTMCENECKGAGVLRSHYQTLWVGTAA